MKRLITAILVLTLMPFTTGVAAASPNAVIEDSVALLSESLDGRREELAADRQALYALIDEILLPRFDRRFAAQVVLAKHWRTGDRNVATESRRSTRTRPAGRQPALPCGRPVSR